LKVSIRLFIDSGEEGVLIPPKIRKGFAFKIIKYLRRPFSENTWVASEGFDNGIN
jgi:hypothetical protein